tara:strand:- start:225 stop:1505 length:1281 start_codon:yes stop_codon:yes gene_type:complete
MSYYENISVLPPSNCGIYNMDNNKIKIWNYWNYPKVEIKDNSKSNILAYFSDLFDNAVNIRLRSDVPVGITYSGGIDSTSILTSMTKSKSNFTAFTSVYSDDERGEEDWAKLGINKYENIKLKSVVASSNDLLDTMTKISWHLDGPTYSPAVLPLWFLMKESRKMNIPVLLEGQGADEELGGYTWYSIVNLLNVISHFITLKDIKGQSINKIITSIIKAYGYNQSILWLLRELFPVLKKVYNYNIGLHNIIKDYHNIVDYDTSGKSINKSSYNAVTKRMINDHSKNILPGLLHYGDSISMAHSIESRHPFLDYRLVEWLFKQPDSTKIYNGVSKIILREYLKMNGQNNIANRYDKKGYPTPINKWLLNENSKILHDTILYSNAKLYDFIEAKNLVKMTKRLEKGDVKMAHHLYKLLSIEIWLNECF